MSTRPAPVLVLAVGNPSRGDDALGPALAARIEAEAWPGVEVITEFQLQVENALDLEGRERVLFVDAGTGTTAPYELGRSMPLADDRSTSTADDSHGGYRAQGAGPYSRAAFAYTTHALPPEAVLATYMHIKGERPPESWILCVRGDRFELGDELSSDAARNLEAAWAAVRDWFAAR